VSIAAAGTARDPGGHLHRSICAAGLLGGVGRRLCVHVPNFLIVAGLGALYVHFGALEPVTAIFTE